MKHSSYTINDETIVIPSPESYKDCVKLIRSDLYRIVGSDVGRRWVKYLFNPIFNKSLIYLRLAAYDKGLFCAFFKYLYFLSSRKYGIQIPPSTRIGYGFYIGHGISIVINGGTIIGNNVNISQFCNIGTNKHTPAIIGDNVYIGPQTCIIEDVMIGNNATIGAGSVVTHDVAPNTTVAGVPAKYLNTKTAGRFIIKRYPL